MDDEHSTESEVSTSFPNIRGSIGCLPEFSFFIRTKKKLFLLFLFY